MLARAGVAFSAHKIATVQRLRVARRNHDERTTERKRGVLVSKLNRRSRQPEPLQIAPEHLRAPFGGAFDRAPLRRDLVGWIGFAWVLHRGAPLVASYADLAKRLGTTRDGARQVVRDLVELGAIERLHYFTVRASGAGLSERAPQYVPTAKLRAVFAELGSRRARAAAARGARAGGDGESAAPRYVGRVVVERQDREKFLEAFPAEAPAADPWTVGREGAALVLRALRGRS